jgi:dimethylglycine dehydrogenase
MGKSLAEWIVGGAPELDMRAFDPRRFGRRVERDYQMAKVKDYFIRRHETPMPGEQSLVGRQRKTSGLYERLVAAGGDFEVVYGWERPRWFRSSADGDTVLSFRRGSWFAQVARECKAASRGVILVDQSAGARFELKGADAGTLLSRLLASRMPGAVGAALPALMANEVGTLELDGGIAWLGEGRFFLTASAIAEQRLADWIDQHRRTGEDAVLECLSQSLGTLLLAGPYADAVLSAVTGSLPQTDLPAGRLVETEVAGIAALLQRSMATGEPGWTLHVAMDRLAGLYEALWQAGQAHGIANAGSYALRSLTLEMGAKGPAEMNHSLSFAQSGLMGQVDMSRGGFVGHAALARQAEAEPARRIVLLELEAGDCDCNAGEAVYRQGRLVGAVTSGGYGHRTGRSLAFALVDAKQAMPGTNLDVLVLAANRKARVINPLNASGSETQNRSVETVP